MKKFLIILLSVLMLTLTFGCKKEEELQWYSKDGLTINLPKDLKEETLEGFNYYLYGSNFMFSALKEDFGLFDQLGIDANNTTVEDYGALIQQFNELEEGFEADGYNNLCITYTSEVDGEEYFYYTTVRKGTDAFWLVTFSSYNDEKDIYQPLFEKWANTIVVE